MKINIKNYPRIDYEFLNYLDNQIEKYLKELIMLRDPKVLTKHKDLNGTQEYVNEEIKKKEGFLKDVEVAKVEYLGYIRENGRETCESIDKVLFDKNANN